MIDRIGCPHCGSVFALEQALDDADARRFYELLSQLPPTLIRPYLRYLKLFKPAKQALKWHKMLVITQELSPMIQAAQITRNKLLYTVPVDHWLSVMTQLVNHPPETLTLPLKGNGYLLSILANQADKQAALQEEQREQQRRNRGANGANRGLQPVAEVILPSALVKPKTAADTAASPGAQPRKPPEGWANTVKPKTSTNP